MSYDTQGLLLDVNGKPIPQFYDPTQDKFIPWEGGNGYPTVNTKDSNGNPIETFSTREGGPVADGINNGDTAYGVLGVNFPMEFNGTAWDRRYNNTASTAFASAARTGAVATSVLTNFNARGVIVTVNVTAASGTGGLTLKIDAIDPITYGQFGPLLIATNLIQTPGGYTYVLYPGVSGGTPGNGGGINTYVGQVLPRLWAIVITTGDASSYTYSVGYQYIN